MTALVLDNEAVQALLAPHHRKRDIVLAHLESQARRPRGTQAKVSAHVPATVRVEAGWDRTDPSVARVNRLRIIDHALDVDRANAAARLVSIHGVSPADAHLGATVEDLMPDEVIVLTSDPSDIERICPPRSVRVIRI